MLDQTAEETQAQLLHRIASRDGGAVAEFYDQVAGLLFSTALRILRDSHEAEEVIQDVFVQIWDKAGTFDPTMGTAMHWALSITRNRCIDRVRARQRRARLMDEFQEASGIESASDDPPSYAGLAGEELAAIRGAVSALPGEQREAI